MRNVLIDNAKYYQRQKRGGDRRQVLLDEEILAHLNHPNIARFLDGGLSEDDRPYLILEYVEGTPLTTYCDDWLGGPGGWWILFTSN